MDSNKFFWLILVLCILSGVTTLVQLLGVYQMSLSQSPQAYESFTSVLANATDIEKVKLACSSLARWDEAERNGRVELMISAPFIALLTSAGCAGLSMWALATSKKARSL